MQVHRLRFMLCSAVFFLFPNVYFFCLSSSLAGSPALFCIRHKEFIIHSTDISCGGRAAEVLFVYSKYSDEDTVYDVLCITRQVDSLLSRSPFPTSSLRAFFFLHLSLLDRVLLLMLHKGRQLNSDRITMNQARIESACDRRFLEE